MESALRTKRGLRANCPKVERLENWSSQGFRGTPQTSSESSREVQCNSMTTPATDFSEAVFRPAPEWRRVAVICAVGAMVLAATSFAMAHWGLDAQSRFVGRLIVSAILGVVPFLLVWRSAVRIDAEGIWRRRFIRWDLWHWAAFSDGRIRDKSSADSFLNPDKTWYWRHLNLGFLAEEERQFIHDVIGKIRTRTEIEVPHEVTISFGLMRRARFTPSGVHLWRGRCPSAPVIPWTLMSPIELYRIDHDRRDFWQLEFRAPASARPILLTHTYGQPTWSGSNAEQLAAFLQRHAPPDRLHVNAGSGNPLDRAEYERRLAKAEKDLARFRKARRLMRWLTLVPVGAGYVVTAAKAGLDPLKWDWFSWLGFFAFTLMLEVYPLISCGALMFQLEREKRKECSELKAWKEPRDQGS
jgi:hypothetical protein